VKFISAKGALFELLGSRLATHFGILVPEPAAVEINKDFADVVSEILCRQLSSPKIGIGLNFGSRVVHPMTTWLTGRTIPDAMFRDATAIFAFDALIQNPDRRAINPNLFTQGDSICVYDHETSFSFLLAIARSVKPWNLEREKYLEEHVFYTRLKSKRIDLSDFKNRLNSLNGRVLTEIKKDIPPEWMNSDFERIEAHLLAIHENTDDFIEQVTRRLA